MRRNIYVNRFKNTDEYNQGIFFYVKNIKTIDSYVEYLSKFYGEINMVHPFREGNGRTEREFMRQYIDFVCKKNNLPPYYLDYNLIEDRDAYIDAIVKADALCSYGDLMALFDRILLVREKEKTIGEGPKL